MSYGSSYLKKEMDFSKTKTKKGEKMIVKNVLEYRINQKIN